MWISYRTNSSNSSDNTVFSYSALILALSYFLFPYRPEIGLDIFGKSIFITQVLLVFAVLAVLFSSDLQNLVKERFRSRVSVLLLMVVAVLLLSTLANQGIDPISFNRLTSALSILLIFIIFSLLKKKFVRKFFVMSAYFTLAASIAGILQFYAGDIFYPAKYFGYSAFYASGFANFPSLFGLHQAIFLPLFWGLAMTNFLSKRRLWLSTVFVGIPAFVLTFSRGAWLAGVIAGLLVLLWAFKSGCGKKLIFSTITASVVLAAVAFFYEPPQRTIFNNYRNSPLQVLNSRLDIKDDSSSRSRLAFSLAAGRMIVQNPSSFFSGLGVRGFYDNWSKFKPDIANIDPRENVDSHSTFLEALVSGGILALAFLTVFIVFLYNKAIKASQKNPFVLPVLAGFTAILMAGLFHNYLYTKYVWIIAGILFALIKMNDHEPQNS